MNTPSANVAQPAVQRSAADPIASTRKRAVLAASIGNILEWYDFVLYAYFSTYIAQKFFPTGNEATSFLITIATFGVGFVARPVGAVVLGSFADRAGRKAALMVVIALMALGTGLIGLTPSYDDIGLWAPATIVVARLMQGFSSGGEWGGATSFVVEHAPEHRRGFYGSWQQFSLAAALLLGSLTGSVLSYALEPAALADWGWRIPFVAGALLMGPFGLWLRLGIDEAHATGSAQPVAATPIREALGRHRRSMVAGVAFTVGWTVTNYLYLVYMSVYLTRTLQIEKVDALLATSIQIAAFMALSPLMGLLSDRIGRRRVMVAGASCVAAGTYPVFAYMAAHPTFATLVPALVLLGLFMAMMTGPAPAWQAELYPRRIRTSAISMSYNLAVTVFGGFAPFVATWLITVTGSVLSLTFYISACAAVSLVTVLVCRETAHRPLP